jgi:hypothetical protein
MRALGAVVIVLAVLAGSAGRAAAACSGDVVTGPGSGSDPLVKVFKSQSLQSSFEAYAVAFTGGVRVGVGDVNGDGCAGNVTGTGSGGAPNLKVFDGLTNALQQSFLAFSPSFTGGIFVAAGDISGDGLADTIAAPDAGGGPQVSVFSGGNQSLLASFFAYTPSFTGGVRVASGDINGDGRRDIITGPGPGAPPEVKVFSGTNQALLADYNAYAANATNGIFVASADVDGDGRADVVTGLDTGGSPEVRVFSGVNNALIRDFFAYGAGFTGGVRVAAVDVNGDGAADIVTGPGPGGGPEVKVFSGASGSVLQDFFAYGVGFTGGVYVGARPATPPTAATLERLRARAVAAGVEVRWRTASETALLGFNVYRVRRRGLVRVNHSLIPGVFPGTSHGGRYSVVDRGARGRPVYRLEAVRLDGSRTWLGSARVL